jgi:hypothetical protein
MGIRRERTVRQHGVPRRVPVAQGETVVRTPVWGVVGLMLLAPTAARAEGNDKEGKKVPAVLNFKT